MAVHKLTIDLEYDFILLGLAANVADYKLCWILNTELNIRLKKRNDLEVPAAKNRQVNSSLSLFEPDSSDFSLHGLYTYSEDDHGREYIVLNNRGSKGLLLPEVSNVTFFLQLKGAFNDSFISGLTEKLNATPYIASAFKIDYTTFKSKQLLLFDYDNS